MAEQLHRHRHHHPTNQATIPLPHGPETGDDHASYPYAHNEANEKAIFNYLLHPNDSFTPDGTYWADLPIKDRIAFVTRIDRAEAKKEFGTFCSWTKLDPLKPLRWYFKEGVLPGAGLGLEGYVLFSIGNLTALYQAVWPKCWKTFEVCNRQWTYAVVYLEVIGIIVGQLLVGWLGDRIGRRWGLIQDAILMLLGLCMIISSWGLDLNGWVICYAWSLFVYGVGVGGEYPMTATAAMENATGSGRVSTREDRLHRGRKVTMAFLMQGWGQFLNQVLLILLLLIFHHGSGNPPYSQVAAQWTWRVSFAIPAVGTLWLVYYRWYKMPLASKQLVEAKRKAHVTGYDVESLKLTCYHFGGRLIATCGGWFFGDVLFYGSKLFQGQFIKTISPDDHSVMQGWLWNLLNVGVSLCGYYLAALLIDNKLFGRKWMQQLGFLMIFILFCVPAYHYSYYSSIEGIHAFQAMYFLSSFFTQFGPNCVTFLVAAEVYPTPIRATAHGFSAAVGKLGALLAAVVYNYLETPLDKFHFVPWFGLAGMLVTMIWLPDTTGLDLKEQERRWAYIRTGREAEYHGIAIHPHHLSLWERWRGVGRGYDPVADAEGKIRDMREDWEAKQRMKNADETLVGGGDGDDDHDPADGYNDEVHSYFAATLRNEKGVLGATGAEEKDALSTTELAEKSSSGTRSASEEEGKQA